MKKSYYILLFITAFIAGCQSPAKWIFSKKISLQDIQPIGIITENETIWLSDVKNNRILKIDLDGKILKEYPGFKRPMHLSINNSQIYVPEYLTDTIKIIHDNKIEIFNLLETPDAPAAIDVQGKTVAIADFYNHRIILQENENITIIGKEGHNDGELYYPTDVEIHNNLIYVADAYNNRVQVFDFHGIYIKMIGWNEGINVATGLTVTNDNIFVADFEGNRILIFDHEGNLVQVLKNHLKKPTDIHISENTMYVANYESNSIAVFVNAIP